MGRPPIGRKAMTPTQRQRRWRKKKRMTAVKTAARNAHDAQLAAWVVQAEKASAGLSEKRFPVILCDPPWDPVTYSDKGKSRHPSRHYPVMAPEAIALIKIPAAPSCVLFLWTTFQMLKHAMGIMEGWGFDYKTGYGWMKPGFGHGYWSQLDQLELLLIGTRGHDWRAPVRGDQPRQATFDTLLDEAPVITADRLEHSRKPAVFYEYIEAMFPDLPKLEMFARPPFRPDWWVTGDEVPGGLLYVPPAA